MLLSSIRHRHIFVTEKHNEYSKTTIRNKHGNELPEKPTTQQIEETIGDASGGQWSPLFHCD